MLVDLVKYIWGALGAFVVVYFLTPVLIRHAARMGAIDQPGERRIHRQATPRNGGIGIFLGVHFVMAVWLTVGNGDSLSEYFTLQTWGVFFLASSVLLVVGLVDDICGMRAICKLGGQIVASVICLIYVQPSFDGYIGSSVPDGLEFLFGLVWLVLLTNAFNLIDGMDGLCSGLGAISAAGIAVSIVSHGSGPDAVLALALLGACLSFLLYNFYPARVFLGDCGSMFIGFTLGFISLPTAKSDAVISIVAPLVVAGIPVFDTLLAVWRRSIRSGLDRLVGKERARHVFQPDRDHLHHRLLAMGLNQARVAKILYFSAASLVAVLVMMDLAQQFQTSAYLFTLLVVVYVVVRHVVHIELWDTGMLLLEGLRRPSFRSVAPLVYLAGDILAVSCAALLAFVLIPGASLDGESQIKSSKDVLIVALSLGPMLIAFAVMGIYRRVWSRAGLFDFLMLHGAVGVGVAAHVVILLALDDRVGRMDMARVLLFGGFAFIGVTLERSVGQLIKAFAARSRRGAGEEEAPRKRVLLYGAGENALLLLRKERLVHPDDSSSVSIEGFIDDDMGLRRRFVKGFQVFGTVDELEEIAREKKINEVVVCQGLDDERWEKLFEIADKLNLRVFQWSCGMESISATMAPQLVERATAEY